MRLLVGLPRNNSRHLLLFSSPPPTASLPCFFFFLSPTDFHIWPLHSDAQHKSWVTFGVQWFILCCLVLFRSLWLAGPWWRSISWRSLAWSPGRRTRGEEGRGDVSVGWLVGGWAGCVLLTTHSKRTPWGHPAQTQAALVFGYEVQLGASVFESPRPSALDANTPSSHAPTEPHQLDLFLKHY